MRYIIIGAGAVGGAIGGRLFAAGHEVVLVARGAHLAALRDGGLRLAVPDGSLTLPIPAVGGPEAVELRPGDVLVLSVKTQDSTALLESWAGRPVAGGGTAGEELPLVCAQNAVENERLALRRFRHVYGMCVWLPATHLEPGRVAAFGSPLTGILHVGRYPSGTDRTAERISADLEASAFLAPVVPDVMRWKYAKLLANLPNALEAVCEPVEGEESRGLYRRVIAEGRAVLDAAGIAYTPPEEERRVRGDRIRLLDVEGAERGGGSSWQSLARGTGSIEADHLNGEITLLARLHGIAAPVNETLQRVANAFARERRAPGSMSASDLLDLVGRRARH
ncbi:2-dehydropantoate 2-reductase N-terminal domain-containing protein [Streptosporangium sp. NPDC023615]|uniref:ketopantoate reductase family protein n=1 Tax=Streptosporangium sp. NPDC023615 TaxID=3154794 RepID=UPI00341F84C8